MALSALYAIILVPSEDAPAVTRMFEQAVALPRKEEARSIAEENFMVGVCFWTGDRNLLLGRGLYWNDVGEGEDKTRVGKVLVFFNIVCRTVVSLVREQLWNI